MALLFVSTWDDGDAWRARVTELMPDLDFRIWPAETGDVAEIDVALVWKPEPGLLKSLPNVKLIASLGMGVDHIFVDPDLPANVPIARIVDPDLIQRMSEYVLTAVLRYHRAIDHYARLQQEGVWRQERARATGSRQIGIMGLGEIGRDTAQKLVALGFPVAGWSRTAKDVPGVTSLHGADGMAPFLDWSEYLVCLLPLTRDTENILDARAFAALPKDAVVINGARGGHVVDADLIAALDSGHLSAAMLDVFREEPLPTDHPFWAHPKIHITPHIAGITNPDTAAAQIVENVRRVRAGKPILNEVDPVKGY